MRCKERSLIWLCSLLLTAVLWGGWLPECAAAEGTVSILCYHDVGNPNQLGAGNNPWTVTESNKPLVDVSGPQEGEVVLRVLKAYGFDQFAHLTAGNGTTGTG